MKTTTQDPSTTNPALQPFGVFIGEWETTGTHAKLPGRTLHGRTSFNWLEDGAFVIMQSESDDQEIPTGVAIFGSDNTKNEYSMLYFDERKVSRKYDVFFENGVLKWSRTAPEFSQRYTFTFTDDNNTITGKGEMLESGKDWEPDLNLVYTRIK